MQVAGSRQQLGRPTPVAARPWNHPRLTNRRPALSGIPDTDTPPYALLSTPVYSLVSAAPAGDVITMNMITYASPIALRPVRKYALGLYTASLTYQHVKASGEAVLQILQQPHAELTQLLGKTSGRDVDKLGELRKRGFKLQTEFGLPVLSDALGVMQLRVVSDFIPAGDHEVVVCDVVAWKALAPAGSVEQAGSAEQIAPLYTGFLRDNGFLP